MAQNNEHLVLNSNFDCKLNVKSLTPLSIKILGAYHIQLLDVLLCVVLPRLEHPILLELAQERLSELVIAV